MKKPTKKISKEPEMHLRQPPRMEGKVRNARMKSVGKKIPRHSESK